MWSILSTVLPLKIKLIFLSSFFVVVVFPCVSYVRMVCLCLCWWALLWFSTFWLGIFYQNVLQNYFFKYYFWPFFLSILFFLSRCIYRQSLFWNAFHNFLLSRIFFHVLKCFISLWFRLSFFFLSTFPIFNYFLVLCLTSTHLIDSNFNYNIFKLQNF